MITKRQKENLTILSLCVGVLLLFIGAGMVGCWLAG